MSKVAVLRMCFLSLIFSSESSLADTNSESFFKTTIPKLQQVVEEGSYMFKIMEYDPPIQVKIFNSSEASYSSPEMATMSLISAMSARDFGWYRRMWNLTSQKIMEDRDKALNQTPDFWTKAWGNAFQNKNFELTQRIETGQYVLIVYKVHSKKTEESENKAIDDIELVTSLKREGNNWFATQELSQDPVLHYWKTPEIKIKRVVRGIEQIAN